MDDKRRQSTRLQMIEGARRRRRELTNAIGKRSTSRTVFAVLLVGSLPATSFATKSPSSHLVTRPISEDPIEVSRHQVYRVPIEGVESKRALWIPGEERADHYALQQQPCPVACLPCGSKTLLRGAVDFVDPDTTWEYSGNRGNEAIGGDKQDQISVLHEATDIKGSRSTVIGCGIYRLGSALISFVSAAFLVAVSAFGSLTASTEARHGIAHDDRDFEYHIGVERGKGTNDAELSDEYMAIGEGERNEAVSEAETHVQEHWLSLRGASSLELQERGDDATEVELHTTAREHLEITSSALGLGEFADEAVDSQSKGISVRMARARRDLSTLDEGGEAREQESELHHSLPGELPSPSHVETAGVHTVRILQRRYNGRIQPNNASTLSDPSRTNPLCPA